MAETVFPGRCPDRLCGAGRGLGLPGRRCRPALDTRGCRRDTGARVFPLRASLRPGRQYPPAGPLPDAARRHAPDHRGARGPVGALKPPPRPVPGAAVFCLFRMPEDFRRFFFTFRKSRAILFGQLCLPLPGRRRMPLLRGRTGSPFWVRGKFERRGAAHASRGKNRNHEGLCHP